MKKLRALGVAGVLSLAMGMPVFAADFAGGHTGFHTGRGVGHHVNFAVCMTTNCVKPFWGVAAVQCNVGNRDLVCQDWSGYCSNYADVDNNGVCDNYTGTGNGGGNGNYVDGDNNGVCDNYAGAGNGAGYRGGGHHGGGHHGGRNR